MLLLPEKNSSLFDKKNLQILLFLFFFMFEGIKKAAPLSEELSHADMDNNKKLNKRASSSGGGISHKRSNFSSLSKDGNNGINIQSCNRLGCSTRYNKNSSIKGDGISNNNTDKKLKSPKSILCTSSTNKTLLNGSSSKPSSSSSSSSTTSSKKEQKKLKPVSEIAVPVESSSSEVGFVESAAKSGNLGKSSMSMNIKSGREVNNKTAASSSSWSSSSMPIRCADTQRKRSSTASSSMTKVNSSSGTRMNQVSGTRLQPSATLQRTRSRPSMNKDNKPSFLTTQKTATVTNQPARVAGSSGGPSSITRPPRLSIRESGNVTFRRTGLGASVARSNHIHTAHDQEDNGITRISRVHGSLQYFNSSEISQVLLALEMIDHREESLQQRLTFENNLILGALGYQDQHRDMRLDIDDMSYEELLDLGEKMGTVSTALTEEALAKCIKQSTYGHITSMEMMACCSKSAEDEIKCSICQEEYVAEDEVGKLICEHLYHVTCIYQWLRQKNWCPICKASACPMS